MSNLNLNQLKKLNERLIKVINELQINTRGKPKKRKKQKKQKNINYYIELWEKAENESSQFNEDFSDFYKRLHKKKNIVPKEEKEEFIKFYFLIETLFKDEGEVKLSFHNLLEISSFDLLSIVERIYWITKIVNYIEWDVVNKGYNYIMSFLRNTIGWFLRYDGQNENMFSFLNNQSKHFETKLGLLIFFVNAPEFRELKIIVDEDGNRDKNGKYYKIKPDLLNKFKYDENLDVPFKNQVFIPFDIFSDVFIDDYDTTTLLGIYDIAHGYEELKRATRDYSLWSGTNYNKYYEKHTRRLEKRMIKLKRVMNIVPFMHSETSKNSLGKFFKNDTFENKDTLNEAIKSFWGYKYLPKDYKIYFIQHNLFSKIFFNRNIPPKVDYKTLFDIYSDKPKNIDVLTYRRFGDNDEEFLKYINEIPLDIWKIFFSNFFYFYSKYRWDDINIGDVKLGSPLFFRLQSKYKEFLSVYWNKTKYGMKFEWLFEYRNFLPRNNFFVNPIIEQLLWEDKLLKGKVLLEYIDESTSFLKIAFVQNEYSKENVFKRYISGSEKQRKFFQETTFPEWEKKKKKWKRQERFLEDLESRYLHVF